MGYTAIETILIAFLFIFLGIILFIFIKMNNIEYNSKQTNIHNYSFNDLYTNLVCKMRSTDAPDHTMLSCIILYIIHSRYNDKSSFFYKNEKAILCLFCFIHSCIMQAITLDCKCKEKFKNGIEDIVDIFTKIFQHDVRNIIEIQQSTYETSAKKKLDRIAVFNEILEQCCSKNNNDFKNNILKTAEVTTFFTYSMEGIIESVKMWCAENEKLV